MQAEEACSAAVTVAEKQSVIIQQLSEQANERVGAWDAQSRHIVELKKQVQERTAKYEYEIDSLRQQLADMQVRPPTHGTAPAGIGGLVLHGVLLSIIGCEQL